ncbi:MAG: glycosyltransferase family 39 protein, partial [Planctomycetes bacterium]|nr:glycosyltransferase family 39 protein [Planctomycetota bacterium]
FCYAWAAELFGRKAGPLALTLWCFCPTVLAWSAVICTDGVAATMGVGASYTFWRWLKLPGWPRALAAGIMLGLAQLAKMTWLPLFILWPALWLLYLVRQRQQMSRKQQAVQLAGILVLGLYTLNLGYAFDGSFTPLGEYPFRSSLFAGEKAPSSDDGNRFSDCALGQLPIPLPKHYVRGLDLQRLDFEKGQLSYLFGKWSNRGWWHYYLVGLVLKVPLGTWGLAVLATAFSLLSFRRGNQRAASASSAQSARVGSASDQIMLLATALMVIVLASSQNGFSRHFRYLLPALPFAYIWISKVGGWLRRDSLLMSAAVVFCLVWTVGSSLAVFPHSMSYFNEIAGGPLNGHRYMLHSSFGWSQDDFYLRRWLKSHPGSDAPYMHLERGLPLERLGLRGRGTPPKSAFTMGQRDSASGEELGPIPGWHVISVQHIHEPDGGYLYFLRFKPVATAGYSIYIYHITLDEANRVRREMRLPSIRKKHPSPEELLSEMATDAISPGRVQAAVLVPDGSDGESVQAVRKATMHDPGLTLALLAPSDIRAGGLDPFDVLIVPGGNSIKQRSALGNAGREAVREFVRAGGGYVGICAGANLAAITHEWSLKFVNARTMTGVRHVPGHGMQKASFRGWGTVSVELTRIGQELLRNTPASAQMEYTGGPILLPANEYSLPDYISLGFFRSEVWRHAFQKETMINSPAIVAACFGEGRVVLFSPHPETAPESQDWLIRSIRACARPRRPATRSSSITSRSMRRME